MEADDIWTWGRPRGKESKGIALGSQRESCRLKHSYAYMTFRPSDFCIVEKFPAAYSCARVCDFEWMSGREKKKEKNGKSRNGRKNTHRHDTRIAVLCRWSDGLFKQSRVTTRGLMRSNKLARLQIRLRFVRSLYKNINHRGFLSLIRDGRVIYPVALCEIFDNIRLCFNMHSCILYCLANNEILKKWSYVLFQNVTDIFFIKIFFFNIQIRTTHLL